MTNKQFVKIHFQMQRVGRIQAHLCPLLTPAGTIVKLSPTPCRKWCPCSWVPERRYAWTKATLQPNVLTRGNITVNLYKYTRLWTVMAEDWFAASFRQKYAPWRSCCSHPRGQQPLQLSLSFHSYVWQGLWTGALDCFKVSFSRVIWRHILFVLVFKLFKISAALSLCPLFCQWRFFHSSLASII